MNGKTLKGQGRGDLAMTLVVVGVALIIGIFVFATIFPAVTNTAIVNDTYVFGAAGTAQSVNFPPVAPDARAAFTLDNCTSSGYSTCVRMNTSNYTLSTDGNTITSITDLGFVSANYTSGRLPTEGQTSATASINNTFTAFTLAAVVLIVIAAAAIIRTLGVF
jgi:hypothetical protein